MANERIESAQLRLKAYYAAEMAILSGQSYTINNKTLTRADLGEVREAIKELESLVDELKLAEIGRGRRRSYRITLRDL